MKIEILDDTTVKVLLTKRDMNAWQLNYSEMSCSSPVTKRVISKLLSEIRDEFDIDFSNSRLYIEAFPYADGGCIIYVTGSSKPPKTERRKGFDTPLIFAFDSLSALIATAKLLNSGFAHIITKSSLHLKGQTYYLQIYSYFHLDGKLISAISEYGRLHAKGAIQSAIIKEHASEIIATEAIPALSEL